MKQQQFSGEGPFSTFKNMVNEGQFRVQLCKSCDQHIFYPRSLCKHCGSAELEWVEVSGEGTVYATTIVRRRPESGPSYSVTLVDLAEGVRMLSRVIDVDPEQVRIGMKVVGHVGEVDGKAAFVFTPAEGEVA